MSEASGTLRSHYRALRPAWAEIDLAAIRHNVRLLRGVAAPARLCAVVKADGYGHGSVAVGRAALEGGASCLAVATVEEGMELRDSHIAAPVLVLSEPPPEAMDQVVAAGLLATLYSVLGVEQAEKAAAAAGKLLDVHVKVDTGMHRVGADPSDLEAILSQVVASPHLRYSALWTHLAVADGTSAEDRRFTATQLSRFADLRESAAKWGAEPPMSHAANSAALLAHPDSRLDMVRCGITVYGVAPSPSLAEAVSGSQAASEGSGPPGSSVCGGLRPAMALRARVSHVQRLEAGERPSYGRLYELREPSIVATVPVGYADGVPRRYFSEGGRVLVGGRRRPLAGSVTMDQIMVDCGPDSEVSVGDEVVLIGEQEGERLTAWDWARVLGTIGYEVLTGIGPRVTRVYTDPERESVGAP